MRRQRERFGAHEVTTAPTVPVQAPAVPITPTTTQIQVCWVGLTRVLVECGRCAAELQEDAAPPLPQPAPSFHQQAMLAEAPTPPSQQVSTAGQQAAAEGAQRVPVAA